MLMIIMTRKLACCSRDRHSSDLHFDDQDRVMTHNGLESCILNSQSYDDESRTTRGDGFATDSLDDDYSSCSSSKDTIQSFTSKWSKAKRDEHGLDDEWELSEIPNNFCVKEKPSYVIQLSDVEDLKEKFSKLLLGEDITGGRNGLSTALALSNAISNLAALVFGELWKLEPLPEERKKKWKVEMDWLLSPTNYMVELVPAKQNGASGGMLEIMTPRARADVLMNLPALQKLDSMLIETLDSMANTEFWYVEVGSRAEGRSKCGATESKRWWLPMPQVPETGLSDTARKELLTQGRVVHQVLKAAKSINQNILLEMPVPTIIINALPKSGKASLNEELYKVLTEESSSGEEMVNALNLKSEHSALDAANRLEAAMFSWKQRITQHISGSSPVRTSWSSFIKDPISEIEKLKLLLDRAQVLLQQLKATYPNLPQTFLDATKVQYGRDIGHSVMEGYSRVLGNLAFSILSRIGDILKEDGMRNPNFPVSNCCSPDINITQFFETPVASKRIRHALSDRMKYVVDGEDSEFAASSRASDPQHSQNAISTPIATQSRWRLSACMGRNSH